MRITQKELARELGISLITVSRAFNNSGYVSQKLKKRIFEYAKEKSYVPHRASQILLRNKIRNIVLFSSSTPDYFWSDIQKGILSAAAHIKPFNYDVRYHLVPDYDSAYYIGLLRKEIENGLDAAAFVYQWMYDMDTIISLVEQAGIPYILFNVDNPKTSRMCYIGTDYRSGGLLAANFIGKALAIKDKPRVLVIGIIENFDGTIGRFLNSERLRGFIDEIQVSYPEIECCLEFLDSMAVESLQTQIHCFLKKHDGLVDAVYCIPAVNKLFLSALEQFNYRRTITLIHDIDTSAPGYLDTGLLTAVVYQDPVQQGYSAVRIMENILESKMHGRQNDVQIAYNLIFKENLDFLRKPYVQSVNSG